MRWLCAALALILAAPILSQTSQEPEQLPAEVLQPNEEARQLFEAAADSPLSADRFDELPAEAVARIDASLEQFLAPGEQVAGWPDVGVDLEQLASIREGGAVAYMTDGTIHGGVVRTYFGDRSLDSIVPSGWVLVGTHGPEFESSTVYIDAGHVSRKVLLVMRVDYRKQGRMRCERRTQTRIYADPDVAASVADVGAFFMSLRLAVRLNGLGLCYGADEPEPGVYISRSFDSSGRRIPELDRNQPRIRVVPAAPMPAAPLPQ